MEDEQQQGIVYEQSGVIPYRWEGENVRLLLITNRSGQRWVIPKGIVEPGMSAFSSAANEAYEEAGIRGTLYPESIGAYDYAKWDGRCRVSVFLMEIDDVSDHWPEDFRERHWLETEEFLTLADDRIPRRLLKNALRLISGLHRK